MLLSSPASERAGINARTAQGWVKRMDNDPEWDIYGKLMNKVNRDESQLQEKHKYSLIHLFDEQPQATRTNAVDSLTATFEDFSLKESQVRRRFHKKSIQLDSQVDHLSSCG
jgi:hypothetical protein